MLRVRCMFQHKTMPAQVLAVVDSGSPYCLFRTEIADYLDIDLFMKPAGYANFNIVFAHGRMVLAYSATGLAAKKLPPITEAGGQPCVHGRPEAGRDLLATP